MLAGVSLEYYGRLERGDVAGVSEGILQAIADALQLDEGERAHLIDLCQASGATRAPRRRVPVRGVRPAVQQVLDAIEWAPAVITDGRLNQVAANALGRALFSPLTGQGEARPNTARHIFLDPCAREFYRDWELAADDAVRCLRAQADRDPHDRSLTDLVTELARHSESFRTRWASMPGSDIAAGARRLHHPLVGALDLHYESFLRVGEDQTLVVYTAERESPSGDGLSLLASWTVPSTSPRAPLD